MCENCKNMRLQIEDLELEIKRLNELVDILKVNVANAEERVEELEEELQAIKDDPSLLMEDWSGDLD
ncbi:MAG TPA: hypothetical protein VMV43_00305 [Candidatus Nanopelagicaceae bacterium]|nr:hypothetical protein [Candidatus Nanopelagicaceae bacterium]